MKFTFKGVILKEEKKREKNILDYGKNDRD